MIKQMYGEENIDPADYKNIAYKITMEKKNAKARVSF